MLVCVGVGETWRDTINCFIVICDCEIFWLATGSCGGGFVSLSVEWGGGGGGGVWVHHMGPGEEFELGEVNAYGVTNK